MTGPHNPSGKGGKLELFVVRGTFSPVWSLHTRFASVKHGLCRVPWYVCGLRVALDVRVGQCVGLCMWFGCVGSTLGWCDSDE